MPTPSILKSRFILFLILAAMVVVVIFTLQQNQVATDVSRPEIIRVTVLPDESKEALTRRYTPLLEHLETETGIKFELSIPEDYSDLRQQFVTHEVDLGYFGGLTFVRTNKSAGVIPLVARNIDINFTSWFIVKTDEAKNSILYYKDTTFTFGNKLSTSGHLMPRYYLLQELQLIPEQFFSEVKYSGAHDRTAYQVRDGIADIGVINPDVFRSMLNDGRLQKNELRIIWETPPYIDYVWAVQKDMDPETRNRIRDAFLLLQPDNPEHRNILNKLGTEGFLPVGMSDFRILQQVADDMGLLGSRQ